MRIPVKKVISVIAAAVLAVTSVVSNPGTVKAEGTDHLIINQVYELTYIEKEDINVPVVTEPEVTEPDTEEPDVPDTGDGSRTIIYVALASMAALLAGSMVKGKKYLEIK